MTARFGGIGVEIMMHREKFEVEYEQVGTLMAKIADQSEVVATLQDDLSKSLEKVTAFNGSLQKLSGVVEFGKRLTLTKGLVDKVRAEIDTLRKLQDVCHEALDRARAALPDYTKFVTNGRLDVPPGGGTFALASKDGVATKFESPSSQKQLDPMASLGAAQLARRFSRQ
jgi:hypothetical protein